MHAPPFSLECIVPDFCFLDAVHLHFSKSSSSMKMCVVSSDSDFDLGFDGMCFATPFWLTGCWISRKWKWSFWLTGTLTYLIFKHLLDIEHPVNQKVHFMAKPMSSKHKTKVWFTVHKVNQNSANDLQRFSREAQITDRKQNWLWWINC